MTRLVQASDEVRDLASRSSELLVATIERFARARVLGDVAIYTKANEDAVALFSSVLALSDLLGRRRMELLYRRAEERVGAEERARLAALDVTRLGAEYHALLPRVEAREAIDDILGRYAELAPGFEAVREVYARRHAVACARALDVAVTERVRDVIAGALRGDVVTPRRVLAEIGGWSQAYADTVYATNVATAYSAGMWGRLAEPEVARVLPGARFVSQKLATSRPNHVACHGLTAPTTARVWDVYSPPLGYRCGCALREVSVFEARRDGLLDAQGRLVTVVPATFGSAHPDPGFGRGRPDRVALFGHLAA